MQLFKHQYKTVLQSEIKYILKGTSIIYNLVQKRVGSLSDVRNSCIPDESSTMCEECDFMITDMT